MSTEDPFQELVDSLRRVLLRPAVTMSPLPTCESAPSPSTSSLPVPSSPMARPEPYSGRAEEFRFTMGRNPLAPNRAGHTYHPVIHLTFQRGFRTLAAASGWNERSLLTTYRLDLEPKLRLQLAALDDHIGLEKFIQHSIRCSDRMTSYLSEENALLHRPEQDSSPEPATEPMILDSGKLSSTERQRRLTRGLCLYCGGSGHMKLNCLSRPRRTWVSVLQSETEKLLPLTTNVIVTTVLNSVTVTALIDSGSAGNFISGTLCRQLKLRTFATSTKYQIHSITGELLSRNQVQRQCDFIQLQLGLLHKEQIKLLVLEGATVDIILGRPWLVKHNPIISWGTGEVLRWGEDCNLDCFPDLPQPVKKSLPVCVTSVESPVSNQSVEIPAIYSDYADVFCPKRASQLPPHRPWDCVIDLVPNASLPKGRIYPLSLPESKAMEEYIREALNGGLHPCIDYRVLNHHTIKFRYPFPLIPAALEQLRSAVIFTKLDLCSAYNLIRIRRGDEWKTAFVTPTGHYEYQVMPYGLVNAPSVFQNFIHEVLREFLHHFVIVYIDDILIYLNSEAENPHHVAEVLQRLREHQLYLKAEKCSFHQKSVQFLGYIIDHHGVRMDEGKVEAVVSWTKPKSIKELQRFLGFANLYRRFIKGYSQITNPLTNLLKGHPKTLNWTTEATTSFETLKKAFTQAPLLTHPDPNLLFVVEVDASTTGVGAVLSQHHSNPPRLHPCAYFSRKLSPAERNYDIGNRELLAIKLALEEWRHWLEGANHPFQVITDHKNLQYLRDAKRLCPRQARWALFFTRFNFSISYRPGSQNVRADALSRLSEGETNTEAPSSIIPNHLIVSPIDWTEPPVVATPEPRVPPGCPPGRKFIPAAQRVNLIHATHTSLGTGHPGANNTLSLLTDRFWWPDMTRDVRRYVQGCKECAMSKSPRHLPAGKLHPLPIPNRPWSHLGVDFMTDLPVSDENTCILVIVDCFSKFYRLIPLKGLPTALETAECLFNHVFRYYGLPEDIVSDRGPQFISRVWKAFFKLLGVTVSLSSGYHPQTNGQTERKIQEVGRFLRTFCHGHQNSWNQFLGWAEYTQNSLRQPSTGLTPFQCVLGFQPPLFPWNGEPSDVPAVDHWFRESERVWDAAHHHLQRAVNRSKAVSDRRRIPGPNFTPGQKVWLSTRDIRLRLPSKKLSPRFIGPFTILEQVNPVTYSHHNTGFIPQPGQEEDPPSPLVLEEGSIYSVNEILQSRRRGGRLEYLVDWEGYGPEERSWVPRDDILDPALMSEFHAAHPEYPAPRGRGRPPRRRRFRPSGAGRGEGGNVTDWPGSNTAVCARSAILVILEYLREEKIVNQRSIHLRTFKTVDVNSPVKHLQSPCFSWNSTIHQYTLHFRTLVAASGWNETVLLGAYRQGLNPQIRTAMALYDDSIGLETFLQRSTRMSQRLAACQPTITAPQPASWVACTPVPEPMQESPYDERTLSILWEFWTLTAHLSHLTPTPRDSRSSGNFTSQACLEKPQLQQCLHKHTLAIKTIQGKPLGCGRIKFSSPVITLQVGLFHREELRFLVLEGSTVSVILGRPWLQLHHPELSWDPCDIIRWGKRCHTNCLVNLPTSTVAPVFLSSTRIESPEPASIPEIPAEYMSFQDVFSKQVATLLPPHRPWDCAIDLLPGAQLPKGRVYPLSIPERQAMEEYIKEALQQGFIQPSTSPAGSSCFFVGKKDGGLRPCIDYRQLNSRIIQQPYPLPLVPAALEELRGAQVFTKLDLRSAYNLVCVREGDK
ncbi:Transposon Tf2-6 polyprotein [Labeo rohita]|uniref:Gypsy retrotransposon integrase-like protein 1 n=1 Tax=Labeo rohita TaxID=84645 RepID=A0ABQ8L1L7_LABRO|nr:Transposon Tf2-6 polyprotein [Labeo rohita]